MISARIICYAARALLLLCGIAAAQVKGTSGAKLVPIAPGWAGNSVNAVIFRKHSVTTHGEAQFAAFYDPEGTIVLAKRKLGRADWQIHKTQYKGKVLDAHNAICIAVDGAGVLHLAWANHDQPLQYVRGNEPGALEVGDMLPMTGRSEDRVTYPEFYNLPDGDLLSLYRIGASGNGNLVLNRYDVRRGSWETVQENLIDGQGRRSAYWQAAVDEQGTLHLSWVWRESGDVATNHDLCYAKSGDGGRTWQKSNGLPSAIPITIDNAEVAARIPQQHELMNQTSMAADAHGHPLIATYWREEGTDVPQYHVVHHDGSKWRDSNVGRQTVAFRLGGAGTKGVPISRPQIMAGDNQAYLLYRDEGRGSKVSLAICNDLTKGQWRVADLTESSVARWEPSYDIALWQKSRQLHAFVQRVEQRDGEGTLDVPPEMVYVLEWRPVK